MCVGGGGGGGGGESPIGNYDIAVFWSDDDRGSWGIWSRDHYSVCTPLYIRTALTQSLIGSFKSQLKHSRKMRRNWRQVIFYFATMQDGLLNPF